MDERMLKAKPNPKRIMTLKPLVAGASLASACLFLLAASQPSVLAPKLDGASAKLRFSRDVRPILSERCFTCHGPDVGARKADLRLDSFAAATAERDGIRPIVPGDPEASEVWRRISSHDPDEVMPPIHEPRPPLGSQELELIRDWIAQGAVYEDHWAFVAPERPELPPELPEGSQAADHPIDRFLLQALEARSLEPSPRAEPQSLLRRLFLDLTGLPPTLAEYESFRGDLVEDGFERAFGRWVQRLFTEEPYRSRYAERMTSPWLDQARYGDTNGIHMDAGRQIWPWRDWVLEAFRSNMPFDQFLTEQLAGDLLPEASVEARIASGFNRNHVITDEGGAIDAEYLVEYAVDRASTTSSVFLGLTMGCARCHDHKFDPITQEDFYRFFAFFNSNEEPGLYTQAPDANRAFEPSLERPSEAQLARGLELEADLNSMRSSVESTSPEELLQLAAFRESAAEEFGLEWVASQMLSGSSEGGADFEVTGEGTLLASGANPATDVHTLRIATEGRDLRLLQLDALKHASFVNGSPGRSDNGNGMLTFIEAEAVSVLDPSQRQELSFSWAWADYAQDNDDYGILRSFDTRYNTGWAIGGHLKARDCSAFFLSDEPFGYEGGTELELKLSYETAWAGTVIGHVGLSLAQVSQQALTSLPLAQGPWYHVGPFPLAAGQAPYATLAGPETSVSFDPTASFEWGETQGLAWRYQRDFADGEVTALGSGVNLHFVGREIYAPEARQVELSLGSDDGFALYLNGELASEREVPRGVQPDQDRVTLELLPGRNTLVFKIINTGGAAGFYYRALEAAEGFSGELLAALVKTGAEDRHAERIAHAWKLTRSEEYAAGVARVAELEREIQALQAEIPRSMVMQERAMPRPTYVLTRGEYDRADLERPVEPGVPRFLGQAPASAPDGRATRLDLARWMTAPENPLVARVAVNRLWQLIFGTGLVPSSADFGYQGSWPTHPELLDWLSVEFIESGWDVQHMLTLMLTSATYQRSSRGRPELWEADPNNRLLASYPRRRLSAEVIRDQALFVAGLLKESFGGPSVKPYQPGGLWQEVSMANSNTRKFERGMGDDLWRRSVYTYWKRACPPPAMMTFDAPTREACTIERATTNTPLQALVLWNDEQFVEAARFLAQRTLSEAGSARERLERMFQRCTGRLPNSSETQALTQALEAFLERYRAHPEDAEALIQTGSLAAPMELDSAALAAWTLMASSMLNLHATITQG